MIKCEKSSLNAKDPQNHIKKDVTWDIAQLQRVCVSLPCRSLMKGGAAGWCSGGRCSLPQASHNIPQTSHIHTGSGPGRSSVTVAATYSQQQELVQLLTNTNRCANMCAANADLSSRNVSGCSPIPTSRMLRRQFFKCWYYPLQLIPIELYTWPTMNTATDQESVFYSSSSLAFNSCKHYSCE